jgi:PAS domain S-box-containing protein
MSASPGLEQPVRVSLSGPLPDTMLQSLALLWELPLATLLLDEHHHIVDINPACAAFTGRPREWLVGRDTLQLHAADDQATVALARERRGEVFEARLLDAQGRERWYRQVQRAVGVAQGHQLWLITWQDRTAEHAARDRADRTLAEFEAWFDLSPVGMVTYDERGLLVRSNAAFEAVVGSAPVLLDQASAALQQLLAWDGSAVAPELQPGAVALHREVTMARVTEPARRLRSTVRCLQAPGGPRRYMAVVEDRSVEDERDQTRLQLAEMDSVMESATAGIAYLRGGRLVRCNRRFEVMLGLTEGAGPGCSVDELFGEHPQAQLIAAQTLNALAEGAVHETEFEVASVSGEGEQTFWYALSVRRSAGAATTAEAIAVLSDVTRLKQQQHQLEMLARERELMFSLSEVGIASVREGRLQRANDALAQLTGWPAGELAGLELSALFIDPGEFARRWPQQERDLRQHGRWSGELQLRRRDGMLLWVQAGLRLVSQGDVEAGFIASFVDVDARHRAELAVALQAERTRAILDSVLVGIVTVGPQGIEWMNRSARRMFGGDLPDFLNQPIGTVATPEPDHPFRRTQYLDELIEGQAETFECRVKARDGREFWVVGNAVVTGRGLGGRQLTYALLDIERRRQAEARMSEAQASLQRIIEAAPMAITLRDARTLKVLQVNEVAARSVGREAADLVGRTPEQIFEPELAAQRRRDMEEALAARTVFQREYRITSAGQTCVWDARYLPLSTVPGLPPDQLLLVSTDVSEQRAAQEARFEAAIAQREMLVKEVHHRIKNNLQGVAGLLQQIGQRKPEVAPVISEVIGQVQAIAQVYGLQVGDGGPLRVASVVEAIAGSVQRTFGRSIRFVIDGEEADARAWALPEAESIPIALTVNELLTNAIKHSVPGPVDDAEPEVTCTLAGTAEGVRIVVANRARLPQGFNLAQVPGGVSGLGLVRALLPRRSASLSIEQQGEHVHAITRLQPPSITRVGEA